VPSKSPPVAARLAGLGSWQTVGEGGLECHPICSCGGHRRIVEQSGRIPAKGLAKRSDLIPIRHSVGGLFPGASFAEPHRAVKWKRLLTQRRQGAKTQRDKAATELREAFGVRGACSRFRSAPRLTTAPASWTHSKRFAWECSHKSTRSLRTTSTVLQRRQEAKTQRKARWGVETSLQQPVCSARECAKQPESLRLCHLAPLR
jgi:hypothetical protein